MDLDFVDCSIDIDEMTNGKIVGSAIRAGKDGGIPWFVFLDPTEAILRHDPETDEWSRNEAAILATADGPGGNVGCPITSEERAHFLSCLNSARNHLSDEQLLRIDVLFAEFAQQKEPAGYSAIGNIAAAPPNFDEVLEEYESYRKDFMTSLKDSDGISIKKKGDRKFPIEKYFAEFRKLAKNYLAKPDDRGRAMMWCLENLERCYINWKDVGVVHHAMSITLIDNWANASWATSLSSAISRGSKDNDQQVDELLHKLETACIEQKTKAYAAYSRADRWRRKDQDVFIARLESFLKQYPNSTRAKRARGYLMNAKELKIGAIAPDFSGNGVDGKNISLSDYRGKVTYVVFWGFW